MKKSILFLFLTLSTTILFGQNKTVQAIRADHQPRHYELLKEYVEFLSLPNTMNDPEQLQVNARFVLEMMRKRGIGNARLLEADTPGAIPAVYGEVLTPGATRTLIFYAHYDGQPVNPDKWAEGLSPVKPQLATAPLDKGGQFLDFPTASTPLQPISVPVVNYDNNQHGENENVQLGFLWDGIETLAAIMLIDFK